MKGRSLVAVGVAVLLSTTTTASCGAGQVAVSASPCRSGDVTVNRQTPVALSSDGFGATQLILDIRRPCDASGLSLAFGHDGMAVPSRVVPNTVGTTTSPGSTAPPGDTLVFGLRWKRTGTQPADLAAEVGGLSTTVKAPGWAGADIEVTPPVLGSSIPSVPGPVWATSPPTG